MLRLAAGNRGRDLASATLPSTRKPVSDSRRAPRCRCWSCSTSFGDQPLERLAAASGWVAGSSSSSARAAADRTAPRSAARPCARASDRAHRRHLPRPGTAAPARAAACPISAPIVLRPSRSSVRTVSGSSRRAETWRASAAPASPSPWRGEGRVRGLDCDTGPPHPLAAQSASPRGEVNRASAQAAAAVGAIATRTVKPSRREPRSTSRTSPSSPPNRCATPVTSSRRPSPSTSTKGDQRPAQRASRSDQRRIACRIGGNRDQRRVERAGVGQPRAGPRAALGGGLRDRMDDQAVRALDGEDDRRVRR